MFLGCGDLGVTWKNKRKSLKKHLTPHLDRFAAEKVYGWAGSRLSSFTWVFFDWF